MRLPRGPSRLSMPSWDARISYAGRASDVVAQLAIEDEHLGLRGDLNATAEAWSLVARAERFGEGSADSHGPFVLLAQGLAALGAPGGAVVRESVARWFELHLLD